MRNLGKIRIDDQLLLQYLKLEGGDIREVKHCIEGFCIEVIMDHPEFPDFYEGDSIPIITPIYDKTIVEGVEMVTRRPIKT